MTPLAPAQTTVTAVGGTWTFQGWDENEKTINGDNVIFTGTWTFEANEPEAPTYNAGYTFVSGTSGKSLPTAVTALLPSDPADYENDATVTPFAPVQTTVTAVGGTWTFQGWDEDENQSMATMSFSPELGRLKQTNRKHQLTMQAILSYQEPAVSHCQRQ